MRIKRFALRNLDNRFLVRQSRQLIIAERGASAKGASPATSTKKVVSFDTTFFIHYEVMVYHRATCFTMLCIDDIQPLRV
jgi:hypothetical protein